MHSSDESNHSLICKRHELSRSNDRLVADVSIDHHQSENNFKSDTMSMQTMVQDSYMPSSYKYENVKFNSQDKVNSALFDVFLGGSCNPTTWRTEIAIPMLKTFGITYYNPQVSCWGPELVELESRAKQKAKILFFVIDAQTRGIVSMIETVSFNSDKLILVIQDLSKAGTSIRGEVISDKEYNDLDRGHYYLQYFVEKQGIPVFKQIPDALTYVCHVLKKGIKLRELYQGTFCPIQTKRDKKEFRDIYLGGSNCAISNWRQEIAIPILKKYRLTHFAPGFDACKERLIKDEIVAIEKSRILLFVIVKNTRSISEMIIAAHYISLKYNIVLCVQFLDDDCMIDEEKLSTLAIQDYNRGRTYLIDIATKSNVPVFDDINKAVMYCAEKCIST